MPTADLPATTFRSAEEAEAVIAQALELVSADPDQGPRLASSGLSLRVELEDIGVVVDIGAAEPEAGARGEGFLRWSFSGDSEREPDLRLSMSAETGNRYLQGRESVAIALARGLIEVSAEGPRAFLALPAARPITERYREVLAGGYPHLLATS